MRTLLLTVLTLASAADGRASAQEAGAPGGVASKADDALRSRWQRLRAEYVRIATPLLGSVAGSDRHPDGDPYGLQTKTGNAEMAYRQAQLDREVAEIGVTEYLEGIFVQDRETAKGEILLAEQSVDRAKGEVERMAAARRRVRELPGRPVAKTAEDVRAELSIEDLETVAKLRLEQATLQLEQARLKEDVLVRFTKPKRVKELQAEVAKRKSVEAARKAEWEETRAKSEIAEGVPTVPKFSPEERQIANLLAEAVRPLTSDFAWQGKPDEFRTFLDGFEAKLGEARALEPAANEARELRAFLNVVVRVRATEPRK